MKADFARIGQQIALGLVTFLCFASTGQAATWYVDADHLISGDGTSWHEAVLTIQEAISMAASWDEIWVKKGVYNLTSSITINDKDVRLYGGFTGHETSLDQRDWVQNTTTIDGSGYAGTCMFILQDLPTIDGFTIRNCAGGAIFMENCYSERPLIRNMVFANNGEPGLSYGGALHLAYSSPIITNTSFWGNQAGIGGAIYAYCGSSPHITNSTFSQNSASNGGAIYASGCSEPSVPVVSNSILWGDSASSQGPEIDGVGPVLVYHSDVDQAGYAASNNNIRQDPLMFGSERPHLRQGSPAIDTGNNTAIYIPAEDFDGDSRIIDGDENGSAIADMGADEFVPGAAFGVWYVDSDVTTSGTGTSWDEALETIEEAVSNAIAGDEIWVKAGTYTPTGGAVIAPLHITVANVGLYGGFAGGESLREQRDWLANETIINGGDTFTRTIHVSDAGGGATIDGFTITHGGTTAALEFFSVSGVNTVANCKFTANSKNSVKNTGSDLQVLRSSFVSNTYNALNTGGPGAVLTVRDSLFKDNTATALSALNSTSVDRCRFIGNSTTGPGAGIAVYSSVDYVTVANSLFVGNVGNTSNNPSYPGGAIYVNFSGLLAVKNSTFYGNSSSGATGSGGAIGAIDWYSAFTVDNSILWGNTALSSSGAYSELRGSPAVTYSNVDQDGFTGNGNIRVAPIFADATDPDPVNWDYRLGSSSPGIDAGDNSIPVSCSTDLNGQQRFLDDPLVTDTGIGSGSIVDMGAYERQVGAVSDQYDLTMAVVGNGTTIPAAGVHSYPVCSTVEVEAVADPEWLFVNWTGNVADTLARQTHIAMTGDQSVTATFIEDVLIFADGFESGSASSWSDVVP